MAVLKNRLLRKNASNGYDTVHLETDASMITGTLPVSHGGTGVTSLDALKSALGVSDSGGTGTSFEITGTGVGNFVRWANRIWLICHVDSTKVYLAATFIQTNTTFSSGSTEYKGSNLAAAAKAYENTIPADSLALAVNTTVHGVTGKIFAATYDQLNGGFMYFFSNGNRSLNSVYWTSSPNSSGGVWLVGTDGSLFNYVPTYSSGFRPFVALKR